MWYYEMALSLFPHVIGKTSHPIPTFFPIMQLSNNTKLSYKSKKCSFFQIKKKTSCTLAGILMSYPPQRTPSTYLNPMKAYRIFYTSVSLSLSARRVVPFANATSKQQSFALDEKAASNTAIHQTK
jgi:hypothetical protein